MLKEDAYKMYKFKPYDGPEKKDEKAKRRKVDATPSGRSKRKLSAAPALEGILQDQKPVKSRTVNETRKQIFQLKKVHPMATLIIGDLTLTSSELRPI